MLLRSGIFFPGKEAGVGRRQQFNPQSRDMIGCRPKICCARTNFRQPLHDDFWPDRSGCTELNVTARRCSKVTLGSFTTSGFVSRPFGTRQDEKGGTGQDESLDGDDQETHT